MNTSAITSSIDINDETHFYKYLITQNIIIQSAEDFVVRKFMKQYIKHTISNLIQIQVKIEFILQEVLCFKEKENYFTLHTRDDLYFCDYVVLSPGLSINQLDIEQNDLISNLDAENIK